MKLIYAKGACSLSVHILLEELGESYEATRVSLTDKKVLESYNPLGYVPALVLDGGEVLLEAISILQYLSQENNSAFMPQAGFERTKCIEWLSFFSSEIHKGMGPLFHPNGLSESFKSETVRRLEKRIQVVEERLTESSFLVGNNYTVADMYALAILRLLSHVNFSLDHYQAISNYKKNLEESPVIKKVLNIEEEAQLENKVREIIPRKTGSFSQEKRH